jgi:hypothetical protein
MRCVEMDDRPKRAANGLGNCRKARIPGRNSGEEIHCGIDERGSCAHRLRPRRLAGYLLYQRTGRGYDAGGKKARSALYHNNHDGTFTDVTEKAGVGYPCWAMGASIGDYNNDGWPDLLVTCFGGVVLYRNNGDGTFSDVTTKAGLGSDSGWATGAAFGDYDGDGWVDLFVAHYVDLSLKDLPAFGSKVTCQYHGIAVQCGPRGLKGVSRQPLPQQRRWNLQRCFQTSRRGRFPEVIRADSDVVRLQ